MYILLLWCNIITYRYASRERTRHVDIGISQRVQISCILVNIIRTPAVSFHTRSYSLFLTLSLSHYLYIIICIYALIYYLYIMCDECLQHRALSLCQTWNLRFVPIGYYALYVYNITILCDTSTVYLYTLHVFFGVCEHYTIVVYCRQNAFAREI